MHAAGISNAICSVEMVSHRYYTVSLWGLLVESEVPVMENIFWDLTDTRSRIFNTSVDLFKQRGVMYFLIRRREYPTSDVLD